MVPLVLTHSHVCFSFNPASCLLQVACTQAKISRPWTSGLNQSNVSPLIVPCQDCYGESGLRGKHKPKGHRSTKHLGHLPSSPGSRLSWSSSDWAGTSAASRLDGCRWAQNLGPLLRPVDAFGEGKSRGSPEPQPEGLAEIGEHDSQRPLLGKTLACVVRLPTLSTLPLLVSICVFTPSRWISLNLGQNVISCGTRGALFCFFPGCTKPGRHQNIVGVGKHFTFLLIVVSWLKSPLSCLTAKT